MRCSRWSGKDVELPWMHVAALSSLADGAGDMFRRLIETPAFGQAAPDQAFLRELMRVIGHRNSGRELLAVLNFLDARDRGSGDRRSATWARSPTDCSAPTCRWRCFRRSCSRSSTARSAAVRNGTVAGTAARPGDRAARPDASTSETTALLLSLVGTGQPRGVSSAAIAALGRLDDPAIARQLLADGRGFTPALRREVLPVLLARADRATVARSRRSRPARCCATSSRPTQVAGLRAHRSAAVRALAAAVFEQPAQGDRRAIIQRYCAALELRGNAARGRTTYTARVCALSSAGRSDGYALGPSVEALKVFSQEEVLTHLVDPNRTIDARYRLYQVETTDGATLSPASSRTSRRTA